ncbi:MAG: DoxX family protein [Pseudomonadota bacterium]
MEWLINDAAPIFARICIVVIFPFSAIDKIINWPSALQQANSSFLPGGPALLVLAMIVEIVTPICIIFNWQAGWAAFVLAGYCAVTALLYHNFWSYPRYWASDSEGHSHVWDFFKNFAIVGGCLFIVLGSDLVSMVERDVPRVPTSTEDDFGARPS